MVFEYAALRGTTNGMDTTVITEIADYYERELGYEIPPMTPLVGRDFATTRAGIHADGLLKDEEIYNIFDTTRLLGRGPRVLINQTSGAAGLLHWIRSHFRVPADFSLEKRDARVETVVAYVQRSYDEGRMTAFGDDELESVMANLTPDLYAQLKELRDGTR